MQRDSDAPPLRGERCSGTLGTIIVPAAAARSTALVEAPPKCIAVLVALVLHDPGYLHVGAVGWGSVGGSEAHRPASSGAHGSQHAVGTVAAVLTQQS